MRQAGLVARPQLKRPPYDLGQRSVIAPNVLARQFQADGPNQKWVADFTYIPTREGWLYLAVVLELFSARATKPGPISSITSSASTIRGAVTRR